MADLTQAQGSLTIVDFNDAPMLQASIEVNSGAPTQVYLSDTGDYSAGNDWSVTPLKLIPQLFKSGTNPIEMFSEEGSLVSVEWAHNFAVSNEWTDITNGSGYTIVDYDPNDPLNPRTSLTIATNVLGNITKQGQIRAKITYTDEPTGLSTTAVALLNVNVIGTQLGSVALILSTDTGLTFKNGTTDSDQVINVTATLMRGSTPDNSHLTYVWKKDTDTISGATGQTLTLTPDDVFSKAIITCEVSDSELGDSYSNSVQVLDVTDPIQVNVVSNIGNIFKINPSGNNATLTALLYRNGYPITPPSHARYIWTLTDKLGNAPVGGWSSLTGGVASFSKTGTGAINTNYVTLSNATGVKVGYDITGTGVPSDTRVNRIDGNKVYLTRDLSGNGTSYSFKLDSNEYWTDTPNLAVTDEDISVKGTVIVKVFF